MLIYIHTKNFRKKGKKMNVQEEKLRKQITRCMKCSNGCHIKVIAKYLKRVGLKEFLKKQKRDQLPKEIKETLDDVWFNISLVESGEVAIYSILDPDNENYLGNIS